MQAAIVQDGVIVNIIEVDSMDFMPGLVEVSGAGAGIGWVWNGSGFSAPESTVSQFDLDLRCFQQRAMVKDELLAWMAADNMSRLRAGDWSKNDLIKLLDELADINAMMQTLSFELAAQAIESSTNRLMTPSIKSAWIAKLTDHLYGTQKQNSLANKVDKPKKPLSKK